MASSQSSGLDLDGLSSGLVMSPSLCQKLVEELVAKHVSLSEKVDAIQSALEPHVRQEIADLRSRLENIEAKLPTIIGSPEGNKSGDFSEANSVETIESRDIQEAVVNEAIHAVGKSTWEAAVFLMFPGISIDAHILLGLATVLNALVQGSLILVVMTAFQESSFALEPEQAKHFREGYAHDYDNMDKHGWVSLATRVCEMDETLEIASVQLEAVKIVVDYTMGVFGNYKIPVGYALSLSVLMVWTLTMVREIRETGSFVAALAYLPKPCSRCVVSSQGRFLFTLKSISRKRFCVLALPLAVARLCIACFFLYGGSVFLANTVQLEDLVLNAVALEFVLDVDELTFNTLVPLSMQSLISNLAPLRRPLSPKVLHVRIEAIFIAVGVALWMVWSSTQQLDPIYTRMQEVHQELCKEPTNFVVAISPMMAASVGPTNKQVVLGTSLQAVAARDVIERGLNRTSKARLIYSEAEAFDLFVSQETFENQHAFLEDTGFLHIDCADRSFQGVSNMYQGYLWAAAAHTANATAKPFAKNTCTDFQHACGRQEAALIRYLCPVTCGCNSSRAGLVIETITGCSPTCRRMAQDELERLPCKPANAMILSRAFDKVFQYFLTRPQSQAVLDDAKDALPDDTMERLKESAELGCQEMFNMIDESDRLSNMFKGWEIYGISKRMGVCMVGWLGALCPQECKCESRLSTSCPKSCAIKNATLGCMNDDERLVALFQQQGMTVTGCDDPAVLLLDPCNHPSLSPYFKPLCPVLCDACPKT